MQTALLQPLVLTPIQKTIQFSRRYPVDFNRHIADLIDRRNLSLSQLEHVLPMNTGIRDLVEGTQRWSADSLGHVLRALDMTIEDVASFKRSIGKIPPKRRGTNPLHPRRAYVADWDSMRETLFMQVGFDKALRVIDGHDLKLGDRIPERKRIGALLNRWVEDRLIWPQEIANAMAHYREITYHNQFAQLRLYGTGSWTAGRVAVLLWRTGWTPVMLLHMVNGLTLAEAAALATATSSE